jgi:hypothetical protein
VSGFPETPEAKTGKAMSRGDLARHFIGGAFGEAGVRPQLIVAIPLRRSWLILLPVLTLLTRMAFWDILGLSPVAHQWKNGAIGSPGHARS